MISINDSTRRPIIFKNYNISILDLTTTANAYYYKIDGFSYNIDGQTVTGKEDHNFSFNARMMASLTLPYDISVQVNGQYRAKQVITQGYRKPAYGLDFGLRKHFFDKKLMLAINCRDVLDSRRWENITESQTFMRHQLNRRRARTVNFTLTYNFGNMKPKFREEEEGQGQGQGQEMGRPEGNGERNGGFGNNGGGLDD